MATDSEVPEWLDNDFVQSLLRENQKGGGVIIVKNLKVQSAVGKGENYASQLLRVSVDLTKAGKTERRSFIIKSLPTSEFLAKFLVDNAIFERETKMYLETLPTLYKLHETNSKTPVKPLAGVGYKTSRPHTLVLEDLKETGYKMAERHQGLDLKHSTLALRALARLHALSIGLKERDETCMDTYGETLYSPKAREMTRQMVNPTVNNISNAVEKWEGYERFGAKIKSINWIDRIITLFKNDGKLAVLNHGDGWVNNMLFKYTENGEVEDVKFVDYQMVRFASPGIDIQYFMHTSPSEEVRTKHWDDLMKSYHEEFVDILQTIGSNPGILSLEGLKKIVEDNLLYGVLTACSILPVVLANTDEAPNMDHISDVDSMVDLETTKEFAKLYGGKRFREVFQRLLLHFERIGVF